MKKYNQAIDRAPATFLVTWDPARYAFSNLEKVARSTFRGRSANFGWSVGEANIVEGDRVFMMRHGENQLGLVGSGTFASSAREEEHWDKAKPEGSTTHYADIIWDVLSEFPLVPLPELTSQTGEDVLWTAHGTGFLIPTELAQKVEEVWGQAKQIWRDNGLPKKKASLQAKPQPDDDQGSPVPHETRPYVYLSYSSNDSKWKDQILDFLSPHADEIGFTVWHDRFLKTGEKVEQKLHEVRNNAIAAIIVLSPNWLDSKYIKDTEWFQLSQRARLGLRLLPIIVNECNWREFEIKEFNIFPPQARPVAAGDVNADLAEFAEIVSRTVVDILEEKSSQQMEKQDPDHPPDDKQIKMETETPQTSALPAPDLRTAAELSSYRSDVAATEDRLGVQSDVENLCQVIMAEQWKPPLSIGLFGDWGSGKSSFINLMQNMISATAERARNDKDSAFVSNIIQIDFNAWHYLDANLWANLVVRILNGIHSAVFERDRGKKEGDEFKQIIAHLHVLQEEVEKFEGQSTQLKSTAGQIDTQIERKRGEQNSTMGMIATLKAAVSDSGNAIAKEIDEVKRTLNEAADKLNLNPETNLSEARLQAQKLSQTGARIVSAWNSMSKNRLWWLVLPFSIIVYLFGASPDLGWISDLPGVQKVAAAGTALFSLFVSWTQSLAPHLKNINSGLNAFETASAKVEKFRMGWLEAKQKKLTELENKYNSAVSEIGALEIRKSEVQQEQKQLEERLEQLMQGRGLEEFLLSRAGSADYQEQLGIIALVHEDMKELQRKLLTGLQVDIDGKTETRRYDRVILYIDDLDRCTPERVVEVLQAVHLLLSIPLFVVIVAADPRWLLQCLLTHYQDLLHEDIDNDNFQWNVTPQNYLEKIFQIPYTLPSMASRDFSTYVSDLFSEKDTARDINETEVQYRKLQNEVEYLEIKTRRLQQEAAARQLHAAKAETKSAGEKAVPDAPEAGYEELGEKQSRLDEAKKGLRIASHKLKMEQLQTLAALPTFDTNPKALNVTANEQGFVTQLLPLLTTPRTTKRLLNVYRLIRVSLNPGEVEAFEREEHQAVLVLLAVMYSYPTIAAEFFTDMRNAKENTIRDYSRQKSINDDNGDWARLDHGINHVPCVQDVNIYRRWLDVVGRFSFHVGYELTREQN